MKSPALACSVALVLATSLAVARGARAADAGVDGPEAVALPEQVACRVRATHFWRKVRLELAPGIPFVEIGGADAADVLVPVAPAPAAMGIKLRMGRIALEGLVPAGALPLRAAGSFVIGEVFLPTSLTDLHWTDAAAGELGIEVRFADKTVKAVKGIDRRLRTRLRCGEVALQTGWPFDYYKPVGGRGLDAAGRFKMSGPVPISATAGGPPLARLVPSRALGEAMTVLERAPGWTRIGVTLDDVILFGWTPASFVLSPPAKTGGDVYGVGGLGLAGAGPAKMKTAFTCDHDLHLLAEAGNQRRTVGTVGAGVRMEAEPGDGEVAVLMVDGLKPFKGARFLVRRAELEGCKSSPTP